MFQSFLALFLMRNLMSSVSLFLCIQPVFFSSLVGRNRYSSWPWMTGTVPSNLLGKFVPHCHICVLKNFCWILQGTLCRFPGFYLCVVLSSSVFCHELERYLSLPGLLFLSLQLMKSRFCLSSFCCSLAWKLFQGSKQRPS